MFGNRLKGGLTKILFEQLANQMVGDEKVHHVNMLNPIKHVIWTEGRRRLRLAGLEFQVMGVAVGTSRGLHILEVEAGQRAQLASTDYKLVFIFSGSGKIGAIEVGPASLVLVEGSCLIAATTKLELFLLDSG